MNLELTPSAVLSKLHSLTPQLCPHKKILVAFSGGLDSHVLLHLLSRISPDESTLRAIYINHGLQAVAEDWDKHCQKACENLGVDFSSVDLNLKVPKGESLEEYARKRRYQALFDNLLDDEILVTAHHQNDQAETLLLQLFRGAGVQGLAAMPSVGEIKSRQGRSKNFHIRPLLNYSRESLETYAREHELNFIEDPSNKDTSFDRNFLRQDIMPLLRQRWLSIDRTISRTATLQAETKKLLDEVANQELPTVLATDFYYSIFQESESKSLAPIVIPELVKQSEDKQRLLLRYWISQQGFLTPSHKKLEHIFLDVIHSATDKQPLIEWDGAELRRFRHHLYIMSPLTSHDDTQVISLKPNHPLYIESIDYTVDPALISEFIQKNKGDMTIRFRQGGETIEIPNRGNISLKNLLQEQQIPPWIRSRLPLIYIGEKLVKVIGLDDFKRHPPAF